VRVFVCLLVCVFVCFRIFTCFANEPSLLDDDFICGVYGVMIELSLDDDDYS